MVAGAAATPVVMLIQRRLPHCGINYSFEELGEDQPMCVAFYYIICCVMVLALWVILVEVLGLQQLLELNVWG